MLTLFAIPKPFRGPTETIQRNAIASWTRLGAGTRVVLVGDEDGIAEAARDLGVEHLPDIARNEFGTPLVSDAFARAGELADGGSHCYVNSDVILLDDFLPALERVQRRRADHLVVGECWNLAVERPVAFGEASWAAGLRQRVVDDGVLRGLWSIDYFAFSGGLYDEVPPFAVGRAGFDNWLVWKARARGATVVDATSVVTAIHQDHGYEHVDGGKAWCYDGPEAVRNQALAGGRAHLFTIDHATHVLTRRGLRRRLPRPQWLRSGMAATTTVRHRLGLRPAKVRQFRTRVALARVAAR
jgi:hypothetical protein